MSATWHNVMVPGLPLMFEHEHHRLIHQILRALSADLLQRAGAHFGGGTYITLRYGEYRWSKDVDFICPFGDGYRLLRAEIQDRGLAALFPGDHDLKLKREPQADQYGIRFPIEVNGVIIKFEILAEGRIALDPPEYPDWADGAPCLSLQDCFAEKLLANADRWADHAIESRDLIDLSVLRFHHPIPGEAIQKAELAYPVMSQLERALNTFQGDPEYRAECYTGLEVQNIPMVADGLDLIAKDLGIARTRRMRTEAHADQSIEAGPGCK